MKLAGRSQQQNTRIPNELFKALDQRARRERKSRSDIVLELLSAEFGIPVAAERRGRPRKTAEEVFTVPVNGAGSKTGSAEVGGPPQVGEGDTQLVDIAQALSDRTGQPRALFVRKLREGRVRLGSDVVKAGRFDAKRISELEVDG